jgi:hypothetical protein
MGNRKDFIVTGGTEAERKNRGEMKYSILLPSDDEVITGFLAVREVCHEIQLIVLMRFLTQNIALLWFFPIIWDSVSECRLS